MVQQDKKPKWIRLALPCLLLTAVMLAAPGCSLFRGKDAKSRSTAQVPAFLSGATAALLTNTPGYSSRLVMEIGSVPGLAGVHTGQLLCRGTKLMFAPDMKKSVEKRSRFGGVGFIWDAADGQGLLLSEALQGYAPISSGAQVTNVLYQVSSAAPLKYGGYQCEQQTATVQRSDGAITTFLVYRAQELKGFPVHIAETGTSTPLTLSLSQVRLDAPPEDAFAPPAGFTKYSSTEAMADEVVMRERNLKAKKPSETPLPEEPPAHGPGR
jgi:hypothetical protein